MRRRFIRKTVRRYRPRRSQVVPLKVSQHVSLTTSASAESRTNLSFIPSDYTEFQQMRTNYERYRMLRAVIHIKPTFNDIEPVDAVAPYVVAPFHRAPENTSFTVAQVLSLDKHKYVAGYRSTRVSYVPAVQDPISIYSFRKWLTTGGEGIDIPWHCGLAAFPASTAPVVYDIKVDLYFQFKNQKLNAL